MRNFDPHARPPNDIQTLYKQYRNRNLSSTENNNLINLANTLSQSQLRTCGDFRDDLMRPLNAIFGEFLNISNTYQIDIGLRDACPVYEHDAVPGLHIIPQLLPPAVQIELLDKLLHRDLTDPRHMTNLHKFYDVPYPPIGTSFFATHDGDAASLRLTPKDPAVHKAITINQLLNKNLRWMTLGGQYDWTNKVYPSETPLEFPQDVATLLHALFPAMQPQAAIVNLYSPGDTLSMHRDVAEQCENALVSISIGCDAIFIVGLDDGDDGSTSSSGRAIAIRLRSGDAVIMSKESRFAWHGVPQIVPDTCPEWLRAWPARDGEYEHWRGWMANKRINLNVRQMFG